MQHHYESDREMREETETQGGVEINA